MTPQSTKRSVGKLFVRPLSNLATQDPVLGTSKIKIEEESENQIESHL